MRPDQADGVVGRAGLGDDLDVVLGVEDQPQPAPDDGGLYPATKK